MIVCITLDNINEAGSRVANSLDMFLEKDNAEVRKNCNEGINSE